MSADLELSKLRLELAQANCHIAELLLVAAQQDERLALLASDRLPGPLHRPDSEAPASEKKAFVVRAAHYVLTGSWEYLDDGAHQAPLEGYYPDQGYIYGWVRMSPQEIGCRKISPGLKMLLKILDPKMSNQPRGEWVVEIFSIGGLPDGDNHQAVVWKYLV